MPDEGISSKAIAEVYKFLPGKNCGDKSPCGCPKCAIFASEILKGRKKAQDCTYLEDEDYQSIVLFMDDYFV
jgi:CO dehydrogenase/acetyl-CoA synthase gamma subunit (corrinoid Fe-S protein)